MKCEICHERDAQAAIQRVKDGEEEELYVCHECAKKERLRRQKKSQRTRKISGLPPGVSMSVTRITSTDGDDAPPFLGALMSALDDMVGDIEKAKKDQKAEDAKSPEWKDLPLKRVKAEYLLDAGLHLEGLSLIGELDAVHRAMRALGLQLVGIEADGIRESGHVYRIQYAGESSARARRLLDELVRQERNARVRLFEEMPRVFGDSLCRALAVLKNCRLLSPGEFYDLLSPLRLAAMEDMLEGVTRADIEKMLAETDLTSKEDNEDGPTRDKLDAARADEMNARFEDVVLNERAEERFL